MQSYYSPDGSQLPISFYFSDNPNIEGSYIEAYTPMLADLYAIEMIYGKENTLDNVNVGSTIHKIPDEILDDPWGITITDLGEDETDLISLTNTTNNNILYLEPGYGSSLDGRDYNFFIYWDSKIEKEGVNLQAQVNGLQAIYNQFWHEDWFKGGYVWKWFLDHNTVGGTESNRFTPQNKPAEERLKLLYGKLED